jgi:hypothetical protein
MTALPVGITVAGRALAYWPGNPLALLVAWDPEDPTAGLDFELDVIKGDVGRPSAVWPAQVVVDGQDITAVWSEAATAAWGPGSVWRVRRNGVTVIAGKMFRGSPQIDDDTPLDQSLTVELGGTPAIAVTVTVGAGGGVGGGVTEGEVETIVADGVAAEAVARQTADAVLAGDITAEATARATAIASAISTEVTNRNSAISTAVNNLINSAPGTLDTLGEIATALAGHDSAVGALTTAINARALATDLTAEINRATAAEALAVPLSLYNQANAMLRGSGVGAASAIFVGTSSWVGRIGSGNVQSMTVAQTKAQLAYVAGDVGYTPSGGISASTVAAAIAELDTEKATATALTALDTREANRDLVHDWPVSGWAGGPSLSWTMTPDGTQSFTKTVTNGRGRFTATTTDANRREWCLFPQTADWEDCEIEALIYGPSKLVAGNSPQLGLVVGAKQLAAGEYQGQIAWTNIAFEFWDTLILGAWESRAGVLYQAHGPSQATLTSDAGVARNPVIRVARRVDFFDVDQHRALPTDLYGLQNGDVVDIVSNTDTTFNRTGLVLSNVDPITGYFQVAGATTASDATDTLAGGQVKPVNPVRRLFPQVLKVRRKAATGQLWAMRYRPEDPPPDWGDPTRVVTATPTQDTDPSGGQQNYPINTGAGMVGICIAHGGTTGGASYGEFGRITARRL